MRDASGLFWVSFMVKAFWGTSDGIAGDGGAKGLRLFYLFTFLLLRDEPAEKDNEETSHHIFPLETWQGIYLNIAKSSLII